MRFLGLCLIFIGACLAQQPKTQSNIGYAQYPTTSNGLAEIDSRYLLRDYDPNCLRKSANSLEFAPYYLADKPRPRPEADPGYLIRQPSVYQPVDEYPRSHPSVNEYDFGRRARINSGYNRPKFENEFDATWVSGPYSRKTNQYPNREYTALDDSSRDPNQFPSNSGRKPTYAQGIDEASQLASTKKFELDIDPGYIRSPYIPDIDPGFFPRPYRPSYRPFDSDPGFARPSHRPFDNDPGFAGPSHRPFDNDPGFAGPSHRPFDIDPGFGGPSITDPDYLLRPPYRPIEIDPIPSMPIYRPPETSFGGYPTTFASELYYTIARDYDTKNLIFSPVSIKTCLALAYMGAEGRTADEVQRTLKLNGVSKEAAAMEFFRLMREKSASDVTFSMVNRIYVDEKYSITARFNDIANRYFGATAQTVRFSDSDRTAQIINSFVEQNTEYKIRNLISPNRLDDSTSAVLVNAIYFKGKWEKAFEPTATQYKNFYLDSIRTVSTPMMHQQDAFLYGESNILDATAIELPYKGTDLKMLIILPNRVDGLAALEDKLHYIDVTKITKKFVRAETLLEIPKFKVEFDLSLVTTLQKLGINDMFSSAADFSSLLASRDRFEVSEVMHKAFIEVDEEGTEAAAATTVEVTRQSALYRTYTYQFIANHPFYFAIVDADNVYFSGHIVNF